MQHLVKKLAVNESFISRTNADYSQRYPL